MYEPLSLAPSPRRRREGKSLNDRGDIQKHPSSQTSCVPLDKLVNVVQSGLEHETISELRSGGS